MSVKMDIILDVKRIFYCKFCIPMRWLNVFMHINPKLTGDNKLNNKIFASGGSLLKVVL